METLTMPELIREKLRKVITSDQPLTTLTDIERERQIAELCNRESGSLTGVDCPECRNRGYFHRVDETGRRYIEPCACMEKRKSLERMAKSGLSELLTRYTLQNWRTPEPWQRKAKQMALQYAEQQTGWFVMSGTVGAGKTHLCTALCGLLMDRGLPVRYMMWRDVAVQAKAAVNDSEEYRRIVEPLKTAKVLYIDDLFKVGKGQQPTGADVSLAFELLNYRYNDRNLLTILSTERSLDEILEIDEAVGSRIYERSKEYYLPLNATNWRLRDGA